MNPGDLTISRSSISTSALPSVGDDESQNILFLTDVDHSDEIADDLDLEPDLKVNLFMASDAHVSELHPGSKAPEKGFLERHKALGIFLIGASAILTVGLVAGGVAAAVLSAIAIFASGGPVGVILWCCFGPGLSFCLVAGLASAGGLATALLIQQTFKQNIRMSGATHNLQQKLRAPLGAQEAKAKARTAKEIVRGMETVINKRGSRSSIAEVDFLVKYSQLPEDLKRDLLARFFKERTKGTEAPATLLQSEEREFESTQKLHSGGLLDTLSTRLRIDRADIPAKDIDESWEDYYKNIFAIVKENRFYQALPQERRDEIEALSTHPATQLFHAGQGLQAVEEAVREGATKVLQEQVLDAVTATRTEQVASGADAIKQWMISDDGQKAINDRLTALKRLWTYVPIIPRTPLPAH
jgi:low affinity Fe/Cu permease